MSLDQLGEMTAQAIHQAGWRQGSVFIPNETIPLSFALDSTEVLAIVTQSCSVVSQRFHVDPLVEAIVARKLPEFNSKAPEANGKNQRSLHLKLLVPQPRCIALQFDFHRRFFFDRKKLAELSCIENLSLGEQEAKKLGDWLGRGYTRIALPDALVKSMRVRLLLLLEQILKKKINEQPTHWDIETIYINYKIHKDGDFFILEFVFLCKSQEIADELDQTFIHQLKDFMSSTGKDNIFIAKLQCGTKDTTFFADVDGYDKFSEWDYLSYFN